MSKIGFERFTAMSDEATNKVQACGNRHMSVAWRLWEITLCRMNNWGHAPFDLKELQMLVCGSVGESEGAALRRGFKTLITLERISPDSTQLCVAVNDDLWRRGGGRGSWDDTCSEPAHRDNRRHAWSATRGWAPLRRENTSKTVQIPEPASGVPVPDMPADPWAVKTG